MTPLTRKRLLGVALIASGLLVWFDDGPASIDKSIVSAAAPRKVSDTPRGDTPSVPVLALKPRTRHSGEMVDLFAPLRPIPSPTAQAPAPSTANMPAAASVEPAPPPAPVAPPFPFAVIGKKLEDGRWDVYLSRQNRVFIARAGETLEGTYRVEAIKPPTMTVQYLPLNLPQSVPIGAFE